MDVPPKKKLKGLIPEKKVAKQRSHAGLFAPFRALGLVTNHVPFAMQVRATKGSSAPPRIHILTSIGKSWIVMDGDKMGLLFVGECDYTMPFVSQPDTSFC